MVFLFHLSDQTSFVYMYYTYILPIRNRTRFSITTKLIFYDFSNEVKNYSVLCKLRLKLKTKLSLSNIPHERKQSKYF